MTYKKAKIDSKKAFLAGDKTFIQELLHPKNDGINLPYSIAHGTLEKGCSSLPHILEETKELYIFLKGRGILLIEGEEIAVESGDLVVVPGGAKQHLVNTGNQILEFFCIVSPPWDNQKEVIC